MQPPPAGVVLGMARYATTVRSPLVPAELSLRGPVGLLDGLLSRSFQQIGDRAAAGLAEFVHAESAPAGP